MRSSRISKIIISSLALFTFAGGFATVDASPAFAKSKSSKSSHSKKSSSKKSFSKGKTKLVPPPPPYAPSILPELAYRRGGRAVVKSEEEKPVNPYAKYIYHRDEQKLPTPVRHNKYVASWNAN